MTPAIRKKLENINYAQNDRSSLGATQPYLHFNGGIPDCGHDTSTFQVVCKCMPTPFIIYKSLQLQAQIYF
ncbi:unnamed protein product [Acanthoscelides obtectus]|uniref:Uncharacterized protein n=1 Tax=Acanthoscelides obtectus TaxID=200917 RepID=A0A9P0NVX6_ACAOB|nr:unnamed protein product [Acanthoscelides obtectus]CAK1658079.1 hypothetical protein AOBTE_LOCUS20686 [Acanthoscelides obtectus]